MHAWRLSVVLLFSALLGLVHAGASQAACNAGCVFQPAMPLGSKENAEAVALGDLNSDGRLDIVAAGRLDSNTVYVYIQSGDDTFLPPVAYQYTGSAGQNIISLGNSVDTGDLNGDGRTDVVVTTSQGIRVMRQDVQGRLGAYQDYATSANVRLRVADLNNDGRLDVAAVGGASGGLVVFLQNTSGTLQAPVTYSVPAGASGDLKLGDLNNDGLTDAVVLNPSNNSYPGIAVLLQRAGGGFQAPVSYDLFDSTGRRAMPNSIAISDVTGDGRGDLIATDFWGTRFALFAQNASGALDGPVYYPLGSNSYRPGATEIADMDQDGRADVVILLGYGMLSVHLQKDDGLRAPGILHSGNIATSSINPHALAIGDLDRDGKRDAVVARDTYSGGVDIHPGTRAELTLTLSADRTEALVDQPTNYTATIVNHGPDVATAVRLTHAVPAGMFSSGQLAPSQGRCDDIKRVCELGALAVGQSATVTFGTRAYQDAGRYINSVAIAALPQDRVPADNSASVETSVTQGADLRIIDHYVARLAGSGELRYTIYIDNAGHIAAENVVVTDTFPAGFTPTGASWREWGGTRSGVCSVSGGQASCAIGTLAPTAPFSGVYPIVISLAGQAGTGANLLNVVKVSAATGDPRLDDNRSARLSDGQGNAINQPPVIASGGPYSVRLGAAVVLDAGASRDPEGQWVDYQWDFPDGSHAYGAQGRYAFVTAGIVPVTLHASDREGASSTETVSVTVVNADPVADAGAPYYLTRKYHQVAFDATRSYDLDGGVLQYQWNFGDATGGSGDQTFHAYQRSGEYLARVTVSDPAASGTASNRVIVLNTIPVADAGGPYTLQKNRVLTLDGSRSTDGDADTLSYAWDLGDGNSTTGVQPTHTYALGGVYSITLTLNDGEVNSAPATTTVTVINHAPVASGAGPYEVIKNQPLVLNGSASTDADGDSLSYRWNFGDGGSGTGVTPTHTYSKSGRYSVTLIVNDGEADSVPYQTTVNVKSR